MSNIFDKFDKMVDTEALKKDVEEAAENGGDFKEVPVGKYEVEINKMELKATKKGDPMLSIWFKIIAGEFKGSLIFYNQVLTTGFGIHNANQFMRSLETGVNVEFNSFKQYNELILDVFEVVENKLEFALDYGQNDKGFNTYKIEDIFDKE